MSRLDEIQERLDHENEPCCDHSGRDEHGCWDCRNTGHAHPPYVDGEAKADLSSLVEFARRVEDVLDDHVSTNEQVFDELDRAMKRLQGGAS